MHKQSEVFLQGLQQKALQIFGLSLSIELSYDLKGIRTIGQCKKISPSKYLIRLHKPLLYAYGTTYLNDVLTHEYAHALQMELYKAKIKPHGTEWKNILCKLHNCTYEQILKPNYEKLKELSVARKYSYFNYTCSCGKKHKLSSIRHKRMQKGQVYLCRACKSPLISYQAIE